MTNRSRTRHRAFTLVESALCIVIVGLMLAAGFAASGSAARGRAVIAEQRTGEMLAQQLLTEIMQQAYVDPDGKQELETQADRSTLDDVGDYDNLSESPAEALIGASRITFKGWRRRASVRTVSVNLATGQMSISTTDVGLKVVFVAATSPRGVEYTAWAVRGASGLYDAATTSGDHTILTHITMTPTGGPTVHTQAPLLNAPTP
ncbi:MAG: hypothetical protein K2W85_14645 [Phycisphaerales bacterium]|nr:hypothetical protein [Phycisphaerales bacterium]